MKRGVPMPPQEPYQPLENYGMIGNLHTVALVGRNGSIDWCCLPDFDSPSVFGSLLDARKGGHFKIAPLTQASNKQFYLSDSNILITRFLSPQGVGEIVDFMDLSARHLYRVVRGIRGTVPFELECFPAFNFARTSAKMIRQDQGMIFESDSLQLKLFSPVRLNLQDQGVTARFSLKAGQSKTFALRQGNKKGAEDWKALPLEGEEALKQTLQFWQAWVSKMQYTGRWREMVKRSALVLKMLTYAPTGAIVASPTTSLPELIGGQRNWDYRSTWIRDASFTLYALLRLGFKEEAHAFMGWLGNRLEELGPKGTLQSVYGLHGEHRLPEKILSHLEGYQKSKPVRTGNKAYEQTQLDIYGELMDAVYLYNKYGAPISYDLWNQLRHLLGYVCRHWRDKDEGIWEVRNGAQHFTYSKVMCWVALDRGLRLAQKRSFPADWRLWTETRDAIYQEVMLKSWDPRQKTFVQHYGSKQLDASTLIMPLVKFISPTDPRMISTLSRIKETLVSDSLVHRYQTNRRFSDGLPGTEGTFSMCTFWYAEVLARSGQVEEARWIFEKMLGYANPLGLFSEEIGPSGEQLGNMPQALTHLALISAAYNIDKILGSS
jgi:GH15 family glucan-1,4-alpha-glucosidase